MSNLLNLFLENLLPIFIIAGTGYLVARYFKTNARSISQIVFYIFSPCLAFNLLYSSQLNNGDILRMFLFAVSMVTGVGLLAYIASRLLRLERRDQAAVMITSMFMNAGNFGLPVVMFAFGKDALAYASIYFVSMMILNNTVGVMIASLGTASLFQSIKNLLKLPSIYAMLLGILFLQTGWKLPFPFERSAKLLADAAIPGMLVLLGVQLQSVRWKGNFTSLATVNTLRLVFGPILAILLAGIFKLQGAPRQAAILEAGMPSAVLNTVLATEFDVDPAFVTAVVVSSTLISGITLTLLIAFLGG